MGSLSGLKPLLYAMFVIRMLWTLWEAGGEGKARQRAEYMQSATKLQLLGGSQTTVRWTRGVLLKRGVWREEDASRKECTIERGYCQRKGAALRIKAQSWVPSQPIWRLTPSGEVP